MNNPSRKPDAQAMIAEYRRQIDQIDESLLDLLITRMDVAVKVGEVKARTGMAVADSDREKAILDRLIALTNNPLSRKHIKRIFQEIFRAAKDVQRKIGG
ncbi:MAG: chorismate mutase [Fidelibacterota bacterium]